MRITESHQKSQLKDEELILNYKATGDVAVLGSLYDRYIHLVFGVCLNYLRNREDSQDAAMSIFEKLVEDLKRHEVVNFKSWLHVMARNHCLMKLRSASFKTDRSTIDINSESGMEYGIWAHHVDGDLEDDLIILENCIDKLENDQQRSVRLFFLEQKCYQEICELTGYEMKKVKSYIQNGKRNLKICVENNRERQN